jgi:hypothetical protein
VFGHVFEHDQCDHTDHVQEETNDVAKNIATLKCSLNVLQVASF